jgi:PAS domain S-box-containing protein
MKPQDLSRLPELADRSNTHGNALAQLRLELAQKTETLEALQGELESARAAWKIRFSAVFDSALNSIFLADDSGTFLDANSAACQLLGYSHDEILRMNISGILLSGSDIPKFHSLWNTHIDARRHQGQLALRHKDGHTIMAEYSTVDAIQPGVNLTIFSDVTAQVHTRDELQHAQQRLRTFSLRQQEKFDQLRRNLARDLHDELGQTLSAIKLEIDMMAAQTSAPADKLYQLIKQSVSTVRDVCRTLRPSALDLGLAPALTTMAKELSLRCDVDIQVHLRGVVPPLSSQTEHSLYRIAQEALTNASNHACAHKIELSLRCSQNRLTLQVLDDGNGFTLSPQSIHSGLGLIGMTERASLLGAHFVLDSAPGKGTRILVDLPTPPTGSLDD